MIYWSVTVGSEETLCKMGNFGYDLSKRRLETETLFVINFVIGSVTHDIISVNFSKENIFSDYLIIRENIHALDR